MAKILYRFSVLEERHELREQALEMLHNMKPKMHQKGPFFANWMHLWMWFVNPLYEIAVTGPQAEEKAMELQQKFLPAIVWVWNTKSSDMPLLEGRFTEDKTRIFICRNYSCQKPTDTVNEAMNLMEET